MKLQRFVWLTIALLAGATAAVHALSNAPAASAPGPTRVALNAPSITLDAAVKMAEQRYHARVVKAEAQHDNGRVIYVLRLLNDSGRVWTVRVDAASGAVL
jgi:uncharacterized membrane protein YkoI